MAECEHEKMTTRYCPECGQAADVTSMNGLLKHISTRVRTCERDIQYLENHPNAARLNGQIFKSKKTLSKWRSWHNGLKALLDSQQEPPQ